MSIVERDAVTRVCPGCEQSFVDRSRTAPRTYCTTCRPPKGAPRAAAVAGPAVKGKPFTVKHFERWSSGFKLKGGDQFRLDDYQRAFLVDLFARHPDGRPVFQELWLVVPEGNGKTTFFTLVALYVIEFEPEAWVPVAASARDQAVDLTYRIAAGFVERNELEEQYRLHPGYRQVVHRLSRGAMKIFASDAASGDGVDPTLALIEELHRLPSMDLYETWSGKLDKSGGQLIVASTAGATDSPFERLRDKVRQAATEVTRGKCFVRAAGAGVVLHEYAVPEDGDPEDLDQVLAANPSRRITRASLARKRAKPTWSFQHWCRFTCNLPTRGSAAAITEREWHDAATAERPGSDADIWVGLDVGWRWDTTAFVPLWWRDDDFRVFLPAKIVEPPRDGGSTHPDAIKNAFLELKNLYRISTVVMDVNGAHDIAAWLADELGLMVVDRVQSNGPKAEEYRLFMEALRQGKLMHSGDEGLRLHAFNAVTQVLTGGDVRFVRPAKQRRGGNQDARVIDALDAAGMVHAVRSDPPVRSGGWGAV